MKRVAAVFLFTLLAASSAQARTVCTAIGDAVTGKVLLQEGDCVTRVTPASTFKIAISLMGFDSGFLKDAHNPTLPFREGYVDWRGAEWKKPTDPKRWIEYSVVWFSQQVTRHLGAARFQKYADAFDYGNRDLSGDPGKNNGLMFSWIGSSLQIAPLEQRSRAWTRFPMAGP
jgi:beta-lactamase class D